MTLAFAILFSLSFSHSLSFWRKRQKKLVAVHRTSQSQHSESNVDWQTSLIVDWQRSARAVCLFMTDLKSKIPHIYIITHDRLWPNIYVLCHCIEQNMLFYFHTTKFRVFTSLERGSKTPSELCIRTPVFLTYSILCSALLCLSNSPVRFRGLIRWYLCFRVAN